MKNYDLSRRRILKGMGAMAGMASTGSFLSIGPAQAAGNYKIQMQLGWLASNGILGEEMADKLGYFAEEGLELEIVPGGPNIDGVASVASGANNFASISSSPSASIGSSIRALIFISVAAIRTKSPAECNWSSFARSTNSRKSLVILEIGIS